MRTYKCFFLVACLLCLSVRLSGQAAAEAGAATAAGATGAAASGKGVSKSIGGVFDSLGKKLEKSTGERATEEDAKTVPSSPKPAPAKAVTVPAGTAAAPLKPVRLVKSSEIKLGTPRADVVREFGQPYMMISQADETGLLQRYFYQGVDEPVVVTFRQGKVTEVTPAPNSKPETPQSPKPEE